MWDKKSPYRLLLFFVLILPTLIFLLLQSFFSIDRSLFVYEYFLVGLLFALNLRSVWPWLGFVFVFVLEISIIFSDFYLFNLPEFLNSFKYLNNYAFNPLQIFLLFTIFFALIGTFFLFNFIKRKIGTDKVCLRLFTAMLVITFALDYINQSSTVSAYITTLNSQNKNFARSIVVFLNNSLHNRNVNANANANAPLLLPMNGESIAFKEYKSDSTSNQMLMIVESFGLINDSLKREEFQKEISYFFENKNWKTSWGKTHFTGATTRAELRELLNCEGDYSWFINSKHAKNFKSIFQIKKQQGYYTNAIHSFKANMFERGTWWRNIGADQVFFSADLLSASNFQSKLNYESPFTSVYDEDAFNFIQAITSTKGKQFVYFLTENTHLPFKGKLNKTMLSKIFDIDKETNLSEEAKNQSKRISNFLAYVASHLDASKFQKLLIVGDHMPPFVNKSDRIFYSDQYVPYCIVTR